MASKDSDSSDKYNVLPDSKKLYWKDSGESNLIHWEIDIGEALKAQFGIFAECIIEEQYPASWTDEFVYLPRSFGGVQYEDLPKLAMKVVDLSLQVVAARILR